MFADPWKTVPSAVALVLVASSSAAAQVEGSWVPVGGFGLTDADALCTQIAFDGQDVCHVAFQDGSPVQERASVMRFVGGQWEFVGARGGASVGRGWYNHLAFDSADRPYVASRDYKAPGVAGVRVMDDALGAWVDQGSGFSPVNAHYTHIAITRDDTPYVVFVDGSTVPADRATLVRFVNGAWEPVGGPGFTPDPAAFTSVALTAQGPMVAFQDAAAGQRTSVMAFDQALGKWSYAGTPGFSAGVAQNVRLALDRDGVPHVTYLQHPDTVWVWRYDGNDWVSLGLASAGDDATVETENWRQWLTLAFDEANRPLVAYQDDADGDRLTVRRRHANGTWEVLGRTGFTAQRADYHALAIRATGEPWVSFRDGPLGGSSLSVMRFVEGVSTYCAAKRNSVGTEPEIGFEGTPTLTGPDDFIVTASRVVNQTLGLVVWGTDPADKPFQGGVLCVNGFVRTAVQPSGGSAGGRDDSGSFAFRFSQAYMSAKGVVPQARIYAQYWFRDPQHPDGTAVGLTGGLTFVVRG